MQINRQLNILKSRLRKFGYINKGKASYEGETETEKIIRSEIVQCVREHENIYR